LKLLATLILAVGIGLAALLLFGPGFDSRRGEGEEVAGPDREAPAPPRNRGPAELTLESNPNQSAKLVETTKRYTLDTGAPAARKVVRQLRGILRADGRPMEEGKIEVRIGERILAQVRTSNLGRFEINFVQESEEAELVTIARGFVPLRQPLGFKDVASTENLGSLSLMRALPLVGTVLDPSGRMVPQAEVEIGLGIRSAQTVDLKTTTDDNGEFLFREAPRGQIVVTASKPGFGARRVEHSHGSTHPIEIKLRRGHVLRLRAFDDLGRPLPSAEVELSCSDPGSPGRKKLTDNEGRASFADLGSPMWNAKIRKVDYRPAGRPRLTADGTEHEIEVPRWPGITGRLQAPSGKTLPHNAQVFALPSRSPSDRMLGRNGGSPVGSDGRFRAGGLRPGHYVLHVRARGFAPYESAPFLIGLNGDHELGEIRLKVGGTLEILCTSAGRPVHDVTCDVRPNAPRPGEIWAPQLGRLEPLPETDPNGRASFVGLNDTVWLLLKKDGFLPAVRGPLRTRDEANVVLNIPMEPGAVIYGSVKDRTGTPQSGVRIRVTQDGASGSKLEIPIYLNSLPGGRYRTITLPPGSYKVETILGHQGTSVPKQALLESGKEIRLDLTITKAQ